VNYLPYLSREGPGVSMNYRFNPHIHPLEKEINSEFPPLSFKRGAGGEYEL